MSYAMSEMYAPDNLISNAEKYPNEPAMSWKESGQWVTMTWSQYLDYTMGIAKAMIAMGFEAGDHSAVFSYNRAEWYGAAHAAMCCGGSNAGAYHTSSSEEVEHVIGNSDAKIVFLGGNPMDGGITEKKCSYRLSRVLPNLDKVEKVVVMDGIDMPNDHRVVSWSDFIASGSGVPDSAVHERISAIGADDLAALVYTSGTSGPAKGVMSTHGNFAFEISAVSKLQSYNRGDGYVSWMPLAHTFGAAVDLIGWPYFGFHMRVVDGPLNSVDYMKECQGALFVSVPRLYEKIYSQLVAGLGGKVKLLPVPVLGGIIKKKAKEKIGFSNVVFAITGAAPISTDILNLFHKLDIPLYEGYGLTETTAGATIGHHTANKIGSVGKAFEGTEIKIADNGEILIRGPHIMKGYYKDPEATAEVMDGDWFKSGDIGRLDDDGFLYITGRIKEIFVSSGGKNIPPLLVEETMKSIPIISQCVLIGDARKYCSALMTLDVGVILRDKFGLDGATEVPKNPVDQIAKLSELGHDLSEFTDSAEVRAEIDAEVQRLNQKFSNPEQIKKFTILPRDLDIDKGEVTATLKLRRKQINENWADEIEAMYADA